MLFVISIPIPIPMPRFQCLGLQMATSIEEINWQTNVCSSSIKEINRLIWKGMSNIYYWKKPTFSKLRFSRKENLKKCTSFEEQKGIRYIPRNAYIGIIVFSKLSSTKPCLRFLLNCFVREIKGFYQRSFRNEVDFRDTMIVFLNISKTQRRPENTLLTLTVIYRKIVQKNKLCHSNNSKLAI